LTISTGLGSGWGSPVSGEVAIGAGVILAGAELGPVELVVAEQAARAQTAAAAPNDRNARIRAR